MIIRAARSELDRWPYLDFLISNRETDVALRQLFGRSSVHNALERVAQLLPFRKICHDPTAPPPSECSRGASRTAVVTCPATVGRPAPRSRIIALWPLERTGDKLQATGSGIRLPMLTFQQSETCEGIIQHIEMRESIRPMRARAGGAPAHHGDAGPLGTAHQHTAVGQRDRAVHRAADALALIASTLPKL